MGTVTEKLGMLIDIKNDIKEAVRGNCVAIEDGEPFSGYASAVERIGADVTRSLPIVRFFFRDPESGREVCVSQNVAIGGSATPPARARDVQRTATNPELEFKGWNVSLNNVIGDKDIGAIYVPTDKKTHLFVSINAKTQTASAALPLVVRKAASDTVSVDWGDGGDVQEISAGEDLVITHAYAAYGDYEIIVQSTGIYRLGHGVTSAGNYEQTSSAIGATYQSCRDALRYAYIGESVTCLEPCGFYSNVNLTSLTLPHTLLNNEPSGGAYAFYKCTGLKTVIFPAGITTIKSATFYSDVDKKTFVFPDTITNIESNAFYNSSGLSGRLVFYSGVISIGQFAFNTGSNVACLREIVFYSVVPPTLVGTNAFPTSINRQLKIYVPDASVTAYKNATNWIVFADHIKPISSMEYPE